MRNKQRLVTMTPTGERKGWFAGSFNNLEFDLRRLKINGKRTYQVQVWRNGRIVDKKYFPFHLYAREYIDSCALKSKAN